MRTIGFGVAGALVCGTAVLGLRSLTDGGSRDLRVDTDAFSRVDALSYGPGGDSYFVIGADMPDTPYGQLGVDFGDGMELVQLEGGVAAASWEPDGRGLVVSVLVGEPIRTRLVRVRVDNDNAVEVPFAGDVSAEFGLDVSSDGLTAVLGGQAGGPGNPSDLYELDLETGALGQLTDTPSVQEFHPVYLDTDRVLYVASDVNSNAEGRSEVMILDRRDGATQRLTPDSVTPSDVALSPDRQLVAFVAGAPGDLTNAALWVMRVDGTGLTRVHGPAGFGPLDFTPDGARLVFTESGRTLVSVSVPELDGVDEF